MFKPFSHQKFILCVFLACASTHTENIIFDLGKVLINPSQFWAFVYIGPWHFVGRFDPRKALDYTFDFLNSLEPRREKKPNAQHEGRQLPQLFCDWLAGIKDSQELRKRITQGLQDQEDTLRAQHIYHVVKAVSTFLFTPELLCKTFAPIKSTTELFYQCCQAHDESGARRHRVFILSNLDPDSYELLKMNPDINGLFAAADGVLISGHTGTLKPDPAIFDRLFRDYQIDPERTETLFIDDDTANIEGVVQMHLAHLKVHRYTTTKALKDFLFQEGIL